MNVEGEIDEIVDIWGKYIKKNHQNNKKETINIASLLWHIWLERNCYIFLSKKHCIILYLHRITNATDLWTGQEEPLQEEAEAAEGEEEIQEED